MAQTNDSQTVLLDQLRTDLSDLIRTYHMMARLSEQIGLGIRTEDPFGEASSDFRLGVTSGIDVIIKPLLTLLLESNPDGVEDPLYKDTVSVMGQTLEIIRITDYQTPAADGANKVQ